MLSAFRNFCASKVSSRLNDIGGRQNAVPLPKNRPIPKAKECLRPIFTGHYEPLDDRIAMTSIAIIIPMASFHGHASA